MLEIYPTSMFPFMSLFTGENAFPKAAARLGM